MLILILLAFFAQPAFASYSLNIQAVDDSIYRNESAVYEVTIKNFGQEDSKYQIYTLDPSWIVKTVPLRLFVPAMGEDKVLVTIRPTSDAGYGTQGVPITVKEFGSDDLPMVRNFVVNLRNENIPSREYAATVSLDISMKYEVDPRDSIPIRIELRNRNQRDIENLTVEVSSDHFMASANIDLSPMSDKTRDLDRVIVDPLTAPGESEVVAKLFFEGELINQLTKNYKIIEYSEIVEDVSESSFFFKTEKLVIVKNEGNVENTAVVSVPTSFIKSFFVNSDQPYERTKIGGETVIVWRIPLEPNATEEFKYVENYRIIVLLLLVILAGLIAYFVLRSPVAVMKEAVGIVKKGDGVSTIKVRIFLKNRSSRLIRDLQVTDRLPSLADVVKAEAPGSITPSKIAVSEKSGTLLKWHLDVLEPYEERVLTYKAKSKLKIIGRMSLPNCKVRFSAGGKDKVVYSNNIEIVEKFRNN